MSLSPISKSKEQCLGGTCFVDLGDDIGFEACEGCEPFRFGKGGLIGFDFRHARSHPLGPTITSRLPGRLEMYTWQLAGVKVLTLFVTAHKSFTLKFLCAGRINGWRPTHYLSLAGRHKHPLSENQRKEYCDLANQKPAPKSVGWAAGFLGDQCAPTSARH